MKMKALLMTKEQSYDKESTKFFIKVQDMGCFMIELDSFGDRKNYDIDGFSVVNDYDNALLDGIVFPDSVLMANEQEEVIFSF